MSVPKSAKPGELRVGWGSSDESRNDLHAYIGDGAGGSGPCRIVFDALNPILSELKERGFDLNTLKFSIRKTQPHDQPTGR